MSSEPFESQRLTRFPGGEVRGQQIRRLSDPEGEGSVGTRRTRFPGGLRHDFTLLTAASLENPAPVRQEEPTLSPPRLPLTVNAGNLAPRQSTPPVTMKQLKPSALPGIRHEDPWLTYRPLRKIKRGSMVQVACTRSIPTRMVTLTDARIVQLKKVIKFQHQNLIVFVEGYEHENRIMVVSEYAQVSLRQTIAIPYDFEQTHVSAVCSQVSR